MKEKAISVTEAARNFADCINRVRYQNTTFVLLKNGARVARLVPDEGKVCRGRDLAKILRRIQLPREEAIAWNRDLKEARRRLMPQPDKWR